MAEPDPNTTVSPRSPLNPSRGELPILQATTDLIKWFVPLLNGLPRDQKFALGDRIISNLYAVLEALVAARWSRDKLSLLEPAAANPVFCIVLRSNSTHMLSPFFRSHGFLF